MLRGALAALFAWVTAVAPVHAVGLTSPEPLAKTYELILDARFDEAEQQLKQACGPAPAAGCQVLRAGPMAHEYCCTICGASCWLPRATASGFTTRCSRPSRWIPRCRTHILASACITTTR